jgi:hypothetical protein
MDLIDLADEELPAARVTVEKSKAAAVTARAELDKHQEWLRHQELYTEAVKGCERRLKRQAFIAGCMRKAWFPIQLVTGASTGLYNTLLSYPRRRSLRANLKDRIQELDHPRVVSPPRQLHERIQAMDRSKQDEQ